MRLKGKPHRCRAGGVPLRDQPNGLSPLKFSGPWQPLRPPSRHVPPPTTVPPSTRGPPDGKQGASQAAIKRPASGPFTMNSRPSLSPAFTSRRRHRRRWRARCGRRPVTHTVRGITGLTVSTRPPDRGEGAVTGETDRVSVGIRAAPGSRVSQSTARSTWCTLDQLDTSPASDLDRDQGAQVRLEADAAALRRTQRTERLTRTLRPPESSTAGHRVTHRRRRHHLPQSGRTSRRPGRPGSGLTGLLHLTAVPQRRASRALGSRVHSAQARQGHPERRRVGECLDCTQRLPTEAVPEVPDPCKVRLSGELQRLAAAEAAAGE